MLRAPDDDTAVREALNALAEEEASWRPDLDQIGTLTDVLIKSRVPSAYQGALEGERWAIIRFS